jgi:asparagine synthase (glutamine-hydrolysing)
MRDVHAGPLRAFSIGFEDPAYDELAYARDVARHVDAEHHALVVRPDPHRIVATVPVHYSEPFADSSALPALEVSRLARTEVTVALSGDGGDESFIGYDRYRASRWAVRADALPPRLRRALAQAAAHLPAARTKGAFARLRRFGESLALPVDRRYARWLTCVGGEQKQALYAPGLQSAVDGFDASALLDGPLAETDAPDPVEALVAADMQTYLPDDLLVKMDIASMAHSLEVRSPLLDHRVVEFAASLPVALKLRGREHKYLLKRAMRGYLPDRILTRRKMGFGVPIDAWLRGELREMVRETLLSRRALERGYFNAAPLRRLVDDHQAGRANHHFTLWALLMLELWHREYVDAPETRRHPLVTVVPAS